MQCPYCQNASNFKGGVCGACGNRVAGSAVSPAESQWLDHRAQPGGGAGLPPSGPPAVRGLAQVFGLHPAAATAMLMVDWMLFGAEVITAGIAWFASIPVGIAMGIAVYMVQKNMYGDDDASAKTKAFLAALLTAIPAPIPTTFILVSGVLGYINSRRRKQLNAGPVLLSGEERS